MKLLPILALTVIRFFSQFCNSMSTHPSGFDTENHPFVTAVTRALTYAQVSDEEFVHWQKNVNDAFKRKNALAMTLQELGRSNNVLVDSRTLLEHFNELVMASAISSQANTQVQHRIEEMQHTIQEMSTKMAAFVQMEARINALLERLDAPSIPDSSQTVPNMERKGTFFLNLFVLHIAIPLTHPIMSQYVTTFKRRRRSNGRPPDFFVPSIDASQEQLHST